jgi:hypothetical protein
MITIVGMFDCKKNQFCSDISCLKDVSITTNALRRITICYHLRLLRKVSVLDRIRKCFQIRTYILGSEYIALFTFPSSPSIIRSTFSFDETTNRSASGLSMTWTVGDSRDSNIRKIRIRK